MPPYLSPVTGDMRIGPGPLLESPPGPLLPAGRSAFAPPSFSIGGRRSVPPSGTPPGPWSLNWCVLWWHRMRSSFQGTYSSHQGGPGLPGTPLSGLISRRPWKRARMKDYRSPCSTGPEAYPVLGVTLCTNAHSCWSEFFSPALWVLAGDNLHSFHRLYAPPYFLRQLDVLGRPVANETQRVQNPSDDIYPYAA